MNANDRKWLALMSITLSAVIFAFLRGETAAQNGQEKRPLTIPLESMYATMGQRPIHRVEAAYRFEPGGKKVPVYPYSYHLMELRSAPLGASNVCLVSGDDITEAIKGARCVFAGAASADTPVAYDVDSKCKKLWLVANFGVAGSDPQAWIVNSVTRHKQTIRVNYTKPERLSTTCDSQRYVLWAPLGELPADTYTLELYDAGQHKVTLLRNVAHLGF